MTRTAIVTGGSRGIGRRLVERLAASGVDVVFTYRRRQEEAEGLVRAIRESGGIATAARVELESAEDIAALVTEHFPEGRRLDYLIASAAASAFRPIPELTINNIERSWATNARSFVLLVQAALPRLGDGGRIVAVTSYGSTRAFPGYGAIGADKAAIESWVRHMAAEFGPRGITVNAVNAGLVDTESLQHYYDVPGMPELQSVIDRVPLRRSGSTDDIVGPILFLTGPDAAYITGQVIAVDGGLTIVAPPFWSEVTQRAR
jgi:NAD(P)-dependent dehydrogenase (short-subunit alcohol dehydrogenase family)